VNLGGGPRQGEDGNVVAGKMLDMVVDQDNVFIVRIADITAQRIS
jgi:hypothetical protein